MRIRKPPFYIWILMFAAVCLLFWKTDTEAAATVGRSTGDFSVSGGKYGEDYRYDNNTLHILSEMPLTISGKTRKDSIQVKSGINASLTLSDADIRVSGCALDMGDGNATLKFKGENYLKSGAKSAGILVREDAKLSISGGKKDSLAVFGGSQAAGIGSEKDNPFGEITIASGTVSAVGGIRAAGIGNGYQGAGGDIVIKGGRVSAKGGSGASGLGIPQENDRIKCNITVDGSCIVYTDSIPDGLDLKNGVFFSEKKIEVSGRVILSYPFETASGQTMVIPADSSLVIQNGLECVNKGEIYVYGSLDLKGSLQNNGQIYDYTGMLENHRDITGNSVSVRDVHDIYLQNGSVLFTDSGYEQSGMQFETGDEEMYTVYGDVNASAAEIEVADGVSLTCALEEVRLKPEKNGYALTIGEGAKLHLILSGENEFGSAGSALSGNILTKKNAVLEVEGDGTLTLTGQNGDKFVMRGTGTAVVNTEDGDILGIGDGDYSVEVKENSRSMEAVLSQELMEALVENRRSAVVEGKLLRIRLNWRSIQEILDSTAGDITIRVSPFTMTDSFSNAKLFIGDRPVYDIQIVEKSGKVISIQFSDGEATLAIPYTKPSTEDIRKLYLVYVGADNYLEWISDSSYDEENNEMVSEVKHFGVYGIGYQIPVQIPAPTETAGKDTKTKN